MELSRRIAEKIVAEVNNIIPQKINLMDPHGTIIASTDPMRVGSFHEGAYRIVTEGLSEVIVHCDGEYAGALRGLNFPIVMGGRTLGVLGITGRYAEIVDSARIIQRMTELLLSEAYHAERRLVGENVRNSYLDEWLNGNRKNHNVAFVERGLALHMDVTVPRRVLACCVYEPARTQQLELETLHDIDSAEQAIRRFIVNADRNNLFLKTPSGLVCLVTPQHDEELVAMAEAMCAAVEKPFPNLRLAVGIDDCVGGLETMHSNSVKAQRALAACMRTRKSGAIRLYGDLNMEVFADAVDSMTKLEYVRRIMRGFSDAEIAQLLPVLEVFYDYDGSLSRAAEALYIHRNTLQYRLRRIAERTGYDPRSIRHSSLFYIAIYFYREVRDLMGA